MSIISTIKRNITYYKFIYDIAMAALALFIIATLLLQGRSGLTYDQLAIIKQTNFTIWLVFVADYIIRLLFAKNKLAFIRSNIIDLISILPFDIMFQGLRAVRLLRVFYMFRVFIYLNRLYKRLSALFTTNSFHHVLWFTFATIFGGAIAISFIEDMEIGDALWWSFVTITTVGYGDISPSSLGGRLVAVFLMIVGIGFVSTLTGTISTYFIKNQTTDFQDTIVQQIIKKLNDFDNLTIDDINTIHSILVTLKTRDIQKQ
ncbi:MAG: Ion transport 2 domain protein [Firmicutes bacterium]|nr:Ion transport 2 domain protein [Bacillota bacterium]